MKRYPLFWSLLVFDQNDSAQNVESYQLEEDLGEDGLCNDSDIDDDEDDEWIHC